MKLIIRILITIFFSFLCFRLDAAAAGRDCPIVNENERLNIMNLFFVEIYAIRFIGISKLIVYKNFS